MMFEVDNDDTSCKICSIQLKQWLGGNFKIKWLLLKQIFFLMACAINQQESAMGIQAIPPKEKPHTQQQRPSAVKK